MPKAIDYTGQTFNQLTVLKFAGVRRRKDGGTRRYWTVECSCGTVKDIDMNKVVKGTIKGCGCQNGKYRGAESIAYSIWSENYNDGDITFDDFLWLTQQPCYLCGKWRPSVRKHRSNDSISFSYHGLDRIDSSKPHTLDNVQPCCWRDNELKSNTNLIEFLQDIESIYNNRLKID